MAIKRRGKNYDKAMVYLLLYSILCFTGIAFGQEVTHEIRIRTSCFKHKSVKPLTTISLDNQIPEGSGLVAWNGKIWTHNDSGLAQIFALDSTDGRIVKTYDLPRVKNRDWEEISQDAHYLYVGDLGNNSGTKERLTIYRIEKEALLKDKIAMDSISFEWPEIQENGKRQKINFDCEAMAVIHDSIFLFTKEWQKRRCSRIFKIPANAGNHIAKYVATIKTRLLVTGANYSEEQKRMVLCGYSLLLTPRLLVFSMPDSGSLSDLGKGTKVRVRKRLRQTEGIASCNGIDYYLISERTNLLLWKNRPKLFRIRME